MGRWFYSLQIEIIKINSLLVEVGVFFVTQSSTCISIEILWDIPIFFIVYLHSSWYVVIVRYSPTPFSSSQSYPPATLFELHILDTNPTAPIASITNPPPHCTPGTVPGAAVALALFCGTGGKKSGK